MKVKTTLTSKLKYENGVFFIQYEIGVNRSVCEQTSQRKGEERLMLLAEGIKLWV